MINIMISIEIWVSIVNGVQTIIIIPVSYEMRECNFSSIQKVMYIYITLYQFRSSMLPRECADLSN